MLKLLEPVRGLRTQRSFGASEVELTFLGSWCEFRLKVIHIVRLVGLTKPRYVSCLLSFDRFLNYYLLSEGLRESDGELLGQVAVAICW